MVDVVAEPERGFLDEPLVYFGSFALTLRRLAYLAVIIALALVDALKMPSEPRVYLPGLELEAGVFKLLGLLPLLPFVYFFLVDRPVRPEAVLLYTLLGQKTQKAGRKRRGRSGEEQAGAEEREEPRVVEKRVTLRMRETGYAAMTLSGSAERETVLRIVVDGVEVRRLRVAGQWSSRVEFEEPGEHTVEVYSAEPPALLARYRVLVER
ncbi:hypothetical protein [Pyrodictium delaneyi]|uniref:hypothetical protein n=1 Tax=Pyrodictium delaneyi TaxID=1273541 RepID=UPI0012E239BF|nr:hypothetical protein [Pyrodictium delaneyi]